MHEHTGGSCQCLFSANIQCTQLPTHFHSSSITDSSMQTCAHALCELSWLTSFLDKDRHCMSNFHNIRKAILAGYYSNTLWTPVIYAKPTCTVCKLNLSSWGKQPQFKLSALMFNKARPVEPNGSKACRVWHLLLNIILSYSILNATMPPYACIHDKSSFEDYGYQGFGLGDLCSSKQVFLKWMMCREGILPDSDDI